MEKQFVSGLGGAQLSPNLLPYGQPPLYAVWQHTRSLAGVSLLLVALLLFPLPALAVQGAAPSTPKETAVSAPSAPAKTQLKKAAPSAPSSLQLKNTPASATAAKAQSPASKHPKPARKNTGKGKASAKSPKTPHADTWAFSTQKPRPVDSIWTQGMAPQALKKAAVLGLTDKALKKGLKAPEVPPVLPPKPQLEKSPLQNPEGTEVSKAKGMQLRGDMDTISSGWHSSGLKNNLRIDQDINRQETNIYGAYADIDAGDDVTLSAGPEFSHTRTQGATQSSTHTQTDSGSLGLGVHLKWDF